MSYEADQEGQDGAGDGTENADDLSMALSGGETTFVSETKQPMSKGTMVVAGLLVACGAITYFMYIRTGPETAAATPAQAQAEQNQLTTRTIKTMKSQRGAAYSEQPIEMSLGGNFTGFYEFLLQLERLPRLTRINQLSLDKITGKEGEMEAKLTLSIFFEPENSGGSAASAR